MIVYWIRKDYHTDIYTQGYVGVTRGSLRERIRSHKKNKHTSIVAHKLRNDDDIVYSIVDETETFEEALKLEALYRPTQNIGWNLQRGGEIGVEPEWYSVPENKLKHSMKTSEATRRGIAANDTTEARSNRAKENHIKYADKYKAAATGERNSKAILTEADVEKIKYELIPQGLKNPEIAVIFGVKPYVISFIRIGKNWSHV